MWKTLFFVSALAAVQSDLIQVTLETKTWVMAGVPSTYYTFIHQCPITYNITRNGNRVCNCGGNVAPLLEVAGGYDEGEYPFIVVNSMEELEAAKSFQCTCPQDWLDATILLLKIEEYKSLVVACIRMKNGKPRCREGLFAKKPLTQTEVQEITSRVKGIEKSWKMGCSQSKN